MTRATPPKEIRMYLTSAELAEEARAFAVEFGCTLPTAEHMVNLFLTAANNTNSTDEASIGREYERPGPRRRRLRPGVGAGLIDGYLRTKLPQAPAIYAEAVARGGDPAAA
ncbi:hypothetical protein GXW82_44430 [Streptacidiphilus sp. 4-A2]|nr:hypothetical protein [Streptacidiphilus sp. 4-A2]